MNITWAALEQMAKGRRPIPLGCTLDYEFRPSLHWYPNIHTVHEFWKRHNPEDTRCFWHLDREERDKAEHFYLQVQYHQYKRRAMCDCSWQRFTLTSDNGNTITLQMDRNGHVDEIRPVQVSLTVFAKV